MSSHLTLIPLSGTYVSSVGNIRRYFVVNKRILMTRFRTLGDFFIFEMTGQRICITLSENNVKCSKVRQMPVKAFGENCVYKQNVCKWYKCFVDGHEDTEDGKRTG